jgi:actin related protein 2/3 complex subunit 5
MSIIHQVTTDSLTDNWRTINIDILDPESSSNFDIATLHPAFAPVSEVAPSPPSSPYPTNII